MIKHIVMWKINDEIDGASKGETMAAIKEKLEALNGQIPGLLKLEVGLDFSNTDASSDVVLYSELESKEALASYQQHPLHQAVIPFIKSVTCNRNLVDYEI